MITEMQLIHPFGIQIGYGLDVGDFELIGKPEVVTIRGGAKRDPAFARSAFCKRLNHPSSVGHFPDPAIGQDGHQGPLCLAILGVLERGRESNIMFRTCK